MKLSALIFLLGLSNLLAGQTIGTIYHPSTITDLIDGACRTKRTMQSAEIVLHPRFNTIQFVKLWELYKMEAVPTPQFFSYYVFRKEAPGILLEATGTTSGLLAATIKKSGIYYGILNGPNCTTVVQVEVGLNPFNCINAIVYECCLPMKNLNN